MCIHDMPTYYIHACVHMICLHIYVKQGQIRCYVKYEIGHYDDYICWELGYTIWHNMYV